MNKSYRESHGDSARGQPVGATIEDGARQAIGQSFNVSPAQPAGKSDVREPFVPPRNRRFHARRTRRFAAPEKSGARGTHLRSQVHPARRLAERDVRESFVPSLKPAVPPSSRVIHSRRLEEAARAEKNELRSFCLTESRVGGKM